MANENKVVNDESILNSVKKLLMLGEEYTLFDQDIILNINTVLANLTQMGVGKKGGLVIFDETTKWSDFIDDAKNLQQIKTYVYLKVRILFDPPANGTLMQALNEQAKELEVRLYTECGGY